IDTGTTLIGGPRGILSQIHQQIPGSQRFGDGTYSIPCNGTVHVSLTFGSKSWSISPLDFNAGPYFGAQCLSAFYEIETHGKMSWVIGDTFLKNVYSVFRYSPPSVGFAELS
ncbi:aspartic peptidase domain-containing protein, partial [Cyathus striatus]